MHVLHIIFLFAIVLGFLVLIHELGHFAMAKFCGVRVETFSIGFGPRIFGYKYGDTDYRVSALPLGGYVKMAGDAVGSEPEEGSWNTDEFNGHPRWQRILIALAGPFANFILSFFLLFLVAHYHYESPQYLSGPAVVDYVPQNTLPAQAGLAPGDTIIKFSSDTNPDWSQILNDCMLELKQDVPFSFIHNGEVHSGAVHIFPGADSSVTADPLDMPAIGLIPREQAGPIGVTAVQSNTPAERAGLKTGDQILAIDGLSPHSVPTLLAYLRDRNGAPATLHVARGGQTLSLPTIPEKMDVPGGPAQFRLGFEYKHPPVEVERLTLKRSIGQSVDDNLKSSTLVLRIVKGMFTRHVAVSSLSGPVGIAQQIDLASQYGYWVVVGLMANISLQLGIFNLLPMPILDGGMIVFLLIESLMRRDVNMVVKERVYQLAFVCFIVFFAFVIFNDITKIHR